MTSSRAEIEKAILDAIADDNELRAAIMAIPEKVEKTVEQFTPVLTGRTQKSISTTHRKTEYKRLGTRRIKIGEVFSEDDPERVAAIEYGRGDGEYGATEGAHMFGRAQAAWDAVDL